MFEIPEHVSERAKKLIAAAEKEPGCPEVCLSFNGFAFRKNALHEGIGLKKIVMFCEVDERFRAFSMDEIKKKYGPSWEDKHFCRTAWDAFCYGMVEEVEFRPIGELECA